MTSFLTMNVNTIYAAHTTDQAQNIQVSRKQCSGRYPGVHNMDNEILSKSMCLPLLHAFKAVTI